MPNEKNPTTSPGSSETAPPTRRRSAKKRLYSIERQDPDSSSTFRELSAEDLDSEKGIFDDTQEAMNALKSALASAHLKPGKFRVVSWTELLEPKVIPVTEHQVKF